VDLANSYPSPPFFTFFWNHGKHGTTRKVLMFLVRVFSSVGRISDSVIRQDHAILLGYAALTQPTKAD